MATPLQQAVVKGRRGEMITGPDVVAVSGCPESRRRVGRGGAYMTTTSTWWVPGGGELPPFEAPSLTSNVAALSSPSSSPPPPPQGDSPIKYRAPKGEKEKPTGVRRNLPPLATQSGRALPLLPFPSSSSHGDGERLVSAAGYTLAPRFARQPSRRRRAQTTSTAPQRGFSRG